MAVPPLFVLPAHSIPSGQCRFPIRVDAVPHFLREGIPHNQSSSAVTFVSNAGCYAVLLVDGFHN